MKKTCGIYFCPICHAKVNPNTSTDTGPFFSCPHCGPIMISSIDVQETWTALDIKLKSAIFYYLRVIDHNYLNESSPYIQLNNKGINIDNFPYDFNFFSQYYPDTFASKINMVLQLLHTQITSFDNFFKFNVNVSTHNINSPFKYYFLPSTDSEANIKPDRNIIDVLAEYGYVHKEYPSNIAANPECKLSFSKDGWIKIDSLSQNQKNPNVFIAMSFDYSDNRIPIAEQAIKNAITRAGYTPIIIKDKEHNNSIPQQIDYEIRHSYFVVTDFTKQNLGAYYEAGLAKGYKKEVIFTCHKNDFNNIHFDTKQINTIKWSNSDNLENDLYWRIHFTIGNYKP